MREVLEKGLVAWTDFQMPLLRKKKKKQLPTNSSPIRTKQKVWSKSRKMHGFRKQETHRACFLVRKVWFVACGCRNSQEAGTIAVAQNWGCQETLAPFILFFLSLCVRFFLRGLDNVESWRIQLKKHIKLLNPLKLRTSGLLLSRRLYFDLKLIKDIFCMW